MKSINSLRLDLEKDLKDSFNFSLTDFKFHCILYLLKQNQYRIKASIKAWEDKNDKKFDYTNYYVDDNIYSCMTTNEECFYFLGNNETNNILKSLGNLQILIPLESKKINRSSKWKIHKDFLGLDFDIYINYTNKLVRKIDTFKKISHEKKLSKGFNQCRFECNYNFLSKPKGLDYEKFVKRCTDKHFQSNPEEIRNINTEDYYKREIDGFWKECNEWNLLDIEKRLEKYTRPEYFFNNPTRIYSLFTRIPSEFRHYIDKKSKNITFLDLDIKICHAVLLAKYILTQYKESYPIKDCKFLNFITNEKDIYQYIKETLNLESREIAKEKFNSFLNSKPADPIHNDFKNIFPELEKFIRYKKYTKTNDSYKIVGSILRSMEANLIWNKWVTLYPDIPQIIVHDGIQIEIDDNYKENCYKFKCFIKNEIDDYADVKIKTIYGPITEELKNFQNEFNSNLDVLQILKYSKTYQWNV